MPALPGLILRAWAACRFAWAAAAREPAGNLLVKTAILLCHLLLVLSYWALERVLHYKHTWCRTPGHCKQGLKTISLLRVCWNCLLTHSEMWLWNMEVSVQNCLFAEPGLHAKAFGPGHLVFLCPAEFVGALESPLSQCTLLLHYFTGSDSPWISGDKLVACQCWRAPVHRRWHMRAMRWYISHLQLALLLLERKGASVTMQPRALFHVCITGGWESTKRTEPKSSLRKDGAKKDMFLCSSRGDIHHIAEKPGKSCAHYHWQVI